MRRSSTPTIELTAMTVIELGHEGVRATGYSNGRIVLTNIYNELKKPAQRHSIPIGEKHSPEGAPAVTAMASISDGTKATLIAGYSDASLRIMKLSLSSNGTPQKHDNSIKIAQTAENCPILSITILDDKSIAIIFANGKIKVIKFKPNLAKCKSEKKVSLDKALNPTPLATGPRLIAAAILQYQLQITNQQPGYLIYVLNAANQLSLYTYDRSFRQAPNPEIISDKVAKIATPTIGSNNLIFALENNTFWQTSSSIQAPLQIDTTQVDLSAGISAITSNVDTIHVVAKNKTFVTILQPLPATPESAPISSHAPPQPSRGAPEPTYMMRSELEEQQRLGQYRTMPFVSQSAVPIPTRQLEDLSLLRSRASTTPDSAPSPLPTLRLAPPRPPEPPVPRRPALGSVPPIPSPFPSQVGLPPSPSVLPMPPAPPGYVRLPNPARTTGGQPVPSSSSSVPPLERHNTVYTREWPTHPASSHPPVVRRQPTQIRFDELDALMAEIQRGIEQSSAATSSSSLAGGGELDPNIYGSHNPFL